MRLRERLDSLPVSTWDRDFVFTGSEGTVIKADLSMNVDIISKDCLIRFDYSIIYLF